MLIRGFQIDGLGHLSTLIADDEAGLAVVVDPRRDVDVYLDAAASLDLRISHVIETHLHNDYVSGGRELAALTGATHVIGAGAELAYEHRPNRHGDAFDVGRLRFTALETPGHTPEHVAYAVADRSRADEPVLLFTGGSLLVGAVGRTDLLGAENARPFADAMFRSLRDVILPHEDFVGVYPTHGSGSLCSTGISSTPSSTIGYERRHNPMIGAADADAFARVLLSGQPAFPRYFARMRPLNQAGPRPLGGALTGATATRRQGGPGPDRKGRPRGRLRSPAAHATSHVPGSLSIPSGSSFGTWLGWVVEPDRPLVFVLERPTDWDDAIRQALRIGYERVAGTLRGGFRAWSEADAPLEHGGRLTVDQLAARLNDAGSTRMPHWSSMCASWASSRTATSPAPSTSRVARSRIASTSCRATGRSRRSARPATGRAWQPRCSGPQGSRMSTGSRTASPRGGSAAMRPRRARRRTRSTISMRRLSWSTVIDRADGGARQCGNTAPHRP